MKEDYPRLTIGFSIEEIRKYILSQDSLGDVLYNLNAENIRKACEEKEETEDDF